MAKVFLSFLGLGSYDKINKCYQYQKTVYSYNGKKSKETEFVQTAEIELLDEKFDKIIIVATEISKENNYDKLIKAFKETNIDETGIKLIIINESMDSKDQWEWFESILDYINNNDEMYIDLTHGYRAIPIVISSAINFLQKSKGIILKGVFYGAYEKDRDCSPIIDMKDFYIINEWSDAIVRFVEEADTRKIIEIAEKAPDFQSLGLNDKVLIDKLKDLTDSIRNIKIQEIEERTKSALEEIEKKLDSSSKIGKMLLKMVIDKFCNLISDNNNYIYDQNYMRIQLRFISLLIDHKLYMQGYTVMREFVGSIGMLYIQKEKDKIKINNKEGRNKRKYADIFVNMIQFEEDKWKFADEQVIFKDSLKPFYDSLNKDDIIKELKLFISDLINIRNGFDHAWTTKNIQSSEIEKSAKEYNNKLNEILERVLKNELLN